MSEKKEEALRKRETGEVSLYSDQMEVKKQGDKGGRVEKELDPNISGSIHVARVRSKGRGKGRGGRWGGGV